MVRVLVGVPIASVDSSLSIGIEDLEKDTSFANLYNPCTLEVNRYWAIRSDIIRDKFVDLLLSHHEGLSSLAIITIGKVSVRDSHILVNWDWSGWNRRSRRSWGSRRILGLTLVIEEGQVNVG